MADMNLYKINSNHIYDWNDIKSDTEQFFYSSNSGSFRQDYNNVNGTFSSGTDYNARSASYYSENESSSLSVNAFLRTLDMMLDDPSMQTYPRKMIMKHGISDSSMTWEWYKHFSNVVIPGGGASINMYTDDNEINSGVSVARVGGTMSARMVQLDMDGDISDAASVEITLNNDGILHFLTLQVGDMQEGKTR